MTVIDGERRDTTCAEPVAVPVLGDWVDAAGCLGQDPELFFPIGSSGEALEQTEEAKRVCRSCGVREECLAAALENKSTQGVWGGSDEGERKLLRKRARRAQQDAIRQAAHT